MVAYTHLTTEMNDFSMDAWRMKQMKETKGINLQRRKRKLADLLEKERLEHTVSKTHNDVLPIKVKIIRA